MSGRYVIMNIINILEIIAVGIFGLMFGSFLNVVIYRLPRKESLAFPASHCPVCGKDVKWYDNVPVLSYMILRGKCRTCKTAISPVYPFVELLVSVMAMWLFYLNGKTLGFVVDIILALILLAAAFIDAKHMIIPDRLNAFGAAAGLILALASGVKVFLFGVMGAVTGIVILMLMYWMGKLFYRREGVGMGDVKLAAVIGIFLGPFWCMITLVLAVFSGGIWGIVQIIGRRRFAGGQIPFGPFISFGGGMVLFFRAQILYLLELYISLL